MLINGIKRTIKPRANLRGADLSRADLSGTDLYGADLIEADLVTASLSRADLSGADLGGANLSGVDWRGANLSGANLRGAKIGEHTLIMLVSRAGRSDGYEFLLFKTDKGEIICAGCRTFTIKQFRQHVADSYPGTYKAKETLDILAFLAKRLKALS